MESIEKSYIYLFSARQWKDASEMQFEVETNDAIALEQYITEEIEKAISFPKGSEEYNRYFSCRHDLLKRHGRINMLGSEHEKEHLVELSLKEVSNEKIRESKKGLIRNNFFSRTGISCLTADKDKIKDRFFWSAFADAGKGFCVEYNWPLLEEYFAQTKAGIRGDYVRYHENAKPKLILQSGYSEAVMDNYCDIIFSLGQLLEDEKEFRLAKVYKEDILDEDNRRKLRIPPDAINTIVFGPKMIIPDKENLLGLVKTKLPSARLMMIHESSGTYTTSTFQAK